MHFHTICEIEEINGDLADEFGNKWMQHESSMTQDDLSEDFSISKLKSQYNWISFRDTVTHKLKSPRPGMERPTGMQLAQTLHICRYQSFPI